ncbi:alanine--tRNA ligase [Candidatus Beckwithbacteria bacterium CG22_combo_CG10-13_8_21_14_all_01_47_9]|uniref:alanine--tRNA ligase n=1 Tax=Candidatus Beckwithbacteria bacterium CG22_combo_CG10-13_8_21_14_all_01_47_9 TaxID=1974496 RepID=A0A2H0E0J7_9BACT|nr:MAG: alanine--tRNA ligase [Candidatus Beckwithbacteria bacterium CG22_combo_CG10-13_8_21_14_all_01_47_9]
MDSREIAESYLSFFKKQGHAVIPPAPLVPPDDPTTLFTSSGMQQLVPYLKGEIHPMGKRLVDAQPCFRAEDIDEVGDNRHTTFFTMLGNWSLGDYFKTEQLAWFWQWLTEELKLPKDRLAVTVFEGNQDVKKDETSAKIWQALGLTKEQIWYYPAQKNWWSRAGEPEKMPAGEIGGPDSEVFFEFTQVKHDPKFGKTCHPNCDCGRWLEIGNSVFMEYEKQADASFKPLPKQNVDFGGGLERLTAASQNQPDIFQTDIFRELMKAEPTKNLSDNRLIADHLRASVAMINEGISPGNKKQGYILRRLIRRAAIKLADPKNLTDFIKYFQPQTEAAAVLNDEIKKFSTSLAIGKKVLSRAKTIDEALAFDIFQSYGLPFEVIAAVTQGKLNRAKFEALLEQHSQKSRTASTGMFKGGLADQSEITTKYHTATHLLQAALRQVLGQHVRQEGSNITADRLRFDFAHPQALSEAEMQRVEELMNAKITANLPVVKTIEAKDTALKSGAMAFFRENYPNKVSVYTIGDFSKELCGGPHVGSTAAIGGVKLVKQESIGAGKRRIYAVLKEIYQPGAET